jgi:diaminohydroxyphosphoribosylaminopyrimidine deaminase/5-amino-6-(5-phosphoribosylamino)uracil reductase
MNTKTSDTGFLRRALLLAARGKEKVFPNPMVGCVIVNDGTIVGEGYHEYFGGPHAEINALRQAGNKANGATLYVTLEPCSHWGKTPPCTDAIIAAGIKKVIACMTDPNPSIAGQGFKKLLKHSIEVSEGILRASAEKLNSAYIHSLKHRKPYVVIKAAMTLDGKIATATGDSKWISSERSRAYVHKLRSSLNAVVVGVGTVVRDNPHLTSHGRGRNPVRVVIDPQLRTPLTSHILDGEAPTV